MATLTLLLVSSAVATDWLVDQIETPSTVSEWQSPVADPVFNAVELGNGLVSRVFSTTPDWATVDFRSYLDCPASGASMLRAVGPEGRVDVACGDDAPLTYDVGGLLVPGALSSDAFLNRTALSAATPRIDWDRHENLSFWTN